MRASFDPALMLGRVGAGAALPADDIAAKIRMVLETRPGQIPWRPDFGCDLASIAGQPATASQIGDARWRIEHALSKWLPTVEIRRILVRVVPDGAPSGNFRNPQVPVAETALLSLGTQARLEVQVEVEIPGGALTVRAPVNP